MINWIFDIYQHTQIDKAKSEAAQARAEAAAIRGSGGNVDTARLELALGELALASKTLQRVLVEKGICGTEELRRILSQVDREDGKVDGRSPI